MIGSVRHPASFPRWRAAEVHLAVSAPLRHCEGRSANCRLSRQTGTGRAAGCTPPAPSSGPHPGPGPRRAGPVTEGRTPRADSQGAAGVQLPQLPVGGGVIAGRSDARHRCSSAGFVRVKRSVREVRDIEPTWELWVSVHPPFH